MTKTNEQKFEERLKEARPKDLNFRPECSDFSCGASKSWTEGARWAYQQAISDVLEKLRSVEAHNAGFTDWSKRNGGKIATSKEWAAWLEKEMRGGVE